MNNQWVFFIVVLPLFFFVFNIARFIVILVHELSHAIPAMIFTKKPVNIFIGHTKTDMAQAKTPIKIGMLKVYIAPTLIYFKRGGFCIYHSNDVSLKQELIIISSGAVVTALLSVIFCYFAFKFDAHAFAKLTLLSFCAIALFSLLKDLYPHKTADPVLDDNLSYSDGNRIIDLLNTKTNASIYIKAVNFYNNRDYSLASEYLTKLIARNYAFADIYRKLISALIMTENYTEAYRINTKFFNEFAADWTSSDHYSSGIIKLNMDLIEGCIANFSECLKLNPVDKFALNNRGYANNLSGRYTEAIADFDKALYLDQSLTFAYCNRGFAKMRTGKAEEGLLDLKQSLRLDENNAYAYLKIGIYHFEKGDNQKALQLFEKAKRMDKNTRDVDKYIRIAKCAVAEATY